MSSSSFCYMGEGRLDNVKQARLKGLSPKIHIIILDVNGVQRDGKEDSPVYDCETVKSIKAGHTHDITKCYTMQVKREGVWVDAVDIMMAPPINHWRRDMFYLSGDVDNISLGHVLRSQS